MAKKQLIVIIKPQSILLEELTLIVPLCMLFDVFVSLCNPVVAVLVAFVHAILCGKSDNFNDHAL